jgi:hypothetical protein
MKYAMLAGRFFGLGLVWMALLAGPAWGQWTTGAGFIYTATTTPRVGIGTGTADPGFPLAVQSSGPFHIKMYNPAATAYTQLLITGDNHEYHIGMAGSGETAYGVANKLFIYDTQADAIRMVVDPSGNVGIGTRSPQHKLVVNGTIGAKDVIVTNAITADYVFKPGYRLRPLSEVDAFIQTNGHLPEIPSEAEAKAQGINVGQMQAKLLAKIEELTLHLIRQEQENQDLKERMRKLESRVAER